MAVYTVKFPKHKDDFFTRIVCEEAIFTIRMRWNAVVKKWFLNLRDESNRDVGIPIPLSNNVPIFTEDIQHDRVRSCMPRPRGLPNGIGLVLLSDYIINEESFNDSSAILLILS